MAVLAIFISVRPSPRSTFPLRLTCFLYLLVFAIFFRCQALRSRRDGQASHDRYVSFLNAFDAHSESSAENIHTVPFLLRLLDALPPWSDQFLAWIGAIGQSDALLSMISSARPRN